MIWYRFESKISLTARNVVERWLSKIVPCDGRDFHHFFSSVGQNYNLIFCSELLFLNSFLFFLEFYFISSQRLTFLLISLLLVLIVLYITFVKLFLEMLNFFDFVLLFSFLNIFRILKLKVFQTNCLELTELNYCEKLIIFPSKI